MAAMDAQVSAFQERLGILERDIGELCLTESSREDYFRIFLEQTVSVLGVGGAIWAGQGDSWRLACHMNLSVAGLEEGGRQHQLAGAAVQRVVQSGSAVVLPGNGGANVYDGGLGDSAENDSPNTLLFVPIAEGKTVVAVLALISPEDVDPRAVRGYAGFVLGLCARSGIFLQRKRIEDLHGEMSRSERLREYVSSLHCSLDPQRVCYALANFGQELLGVYRCMAGTFDVRGKFRVESVSGLESVAVKSSFVQSITEVARVVCKNNRVLLVDNPDAVNSEGYEADDLVTAARLYMLQAESKSLGIFPIQYEGHVVGALIVEKAAETAIDESERLQCEALLGEAGVALHNSMSYRHLPFSLLSRAVASVRDRIWHMSHIRRVVWAAVILIVVLAPFLIPMQVKVVGTAELVAVSARVSYAQQDGVVSEVMIPEDRMVEAGQVLASLDSRVLESDIERVTHQIDEAQLLLSSEIRQNGRSALASRYSIDIEILNSELTKLRQQLEQYQIISPVSGMVVNSDSSIEHLMARPVSRGEAVLEIVPAGTDWQLSVSVPENKAGDLLHAYDNLAPGESLRAWVILNAFPDMKFASEVVSVAPRAQVIPTGEREYRNVISLRVSAPEELRDLVLRQGMEGKVAVECGQGSLMYAVTSEFVDFVRRATF